MIKVGDVMTSEFASVEPSAPIVEVAQKMKDWEAAAIPVCDGARFQGVITERSLITAIVATASSPRKTRARALVNAPYPTVSPEDDITRAAAVMIDHGVRVLPVTHNEQLLGLFTLDDLARESMALAAVILTKTARLPARAGNMFSQAGSSASCTESPG